MKDEHDFEQYNESLWQSMRQVYGNFQSLPQLHPEAFRAAAQQCPGALIDVT